MNKTQVTEPVPQIYTDIVSLLRILMVNSWLIVLMAAVLGAAAFFISDRLTPTYLAETSVIVSPTLRPPDDNTLLYSIDVLNPNIVGTYVQILNSRVLKQQALEALAATYDQALLEEAEVEIRPIQNSTVIVVSVQAAKAELSADLANKIAQLAVENPTVRAFERSFPMTILDPAVVPDEPIAPQKRLNLVIGVAAGLGLGIAAAFLLDIFVKSNRRKSLQ